MTPTEALARVVAALPAAEERPGQREMASAVSAAITDQHHLVVQAGTGTGKTLGYLVPAIVAGKRTVVATATKALQDQLAAKDLPFLQEHLGVDFTWSVLKGRSNYVCMQRVRELAVGRHRPAGAGGDGRQHQAGDHAPRRVGGDDAHRRRQPTCPRRSPTGRGRRSASAATSAPERSAARWVTCASPRPPAERAEHADVVVVNLHLYGLDVAADGAILPPHDVLVVDEAHQLEDIASDTVGLQIAPSRFVTVSAALRKVLAEPDVPAAVAEAASGLREVLQPSVGERLGVPLPDAVVDVLVDGRRRLGGGDERAARPRPGRQVDSHAGGPAACPAGVTAHRPAGRGDRRGDAGGRRVGAVRQRIAGAPAPGDRPARRRPDPARGGVGPAHRDPRQRDDPAGAAQPRSACRRSGSCSSTSAARSTTPTTPCCTAPVTSPTRATRTTRR